MCIGATQDKKICFDVYTDWLNGSVTDKKNLLLRGLVLNQDDIASIIEKGASNSTDPKLLPWSTMIATFGQATENVLLNKADILGRLMIQVLGPVASLARRYAERDALPHALIAVGVISKTPVLRLELSGTGKEFLEYVVKELIKARGDVTNARGLQAAVRREMKLLEIKGGKLTGTRSKKFLALVAKLDDEVRGAATCPSDGAGADMGVS